ncbi:tRNA (guanosine(46)-N7)-methyltransferase TrmB [Merdimonas faecis]
MRLRNIPRAESVLRECKEVVKNASEHKNCWKKVFGNDHPVHIEIGMGKGQFLLALARRNPEINYIGIERYSSVLLRAVEKYEKLSADTQKPLPNIRFICMDAREITEVFAPGEVGKIYLNFSDPWPKARHARRRLTSSDFLALYDQILTSDGTVEFKTDNRVLFDFSVEEVKASSLFELTGLTYDLHHDSNMNAGNIMTEYEEKFSSAGGAICKLVAARKGSAAGCI